VTNSIIYWNAAQQIAGSANVTYSDVQGGYAGTGNINCNPLLHPARLWITFPSCCIDAGNSDPAYNDTCFCGEFSLGTVRNDMGAHGGPGACQWPCSEPPSIVAAPQSQNSCVGQSPTFIVTAAGSPPLSYQWYSGAGVMSGQTNASLTLTNLQKSQAGPYSAVVTNLYGETNATGQLNAFDACIDIHMYAGLNISGQQGSTYVLSYNTDLNNTNGWIPLATNLMGSTPWFYLDMDSPFSPRRFYEAVLKP
jgi:hypothetical protein